MSVDCLKLVPNIIPTVKAQMVFELIKSIYKILKAVLASSSHCSILNETPLACKASQENELQ